VIEMQVRIFLSF